MLRRRLLTILAASAVLSAAFAGPAAALDLAEEPDEVAAEMDEGTDGATEPVEAAFDDTAVEEPAEEVTQVVDDAAEQLPTPTSSPDPEPEPEAPTPAPARSSATPDTEDGARTDVVAAGDVVDAPGPDLRTGRGRLWPLPDGVPPAARAPMTAPAAPAADEVEAPLVAPPPADDASAPTVLALPAATPTPDEDSPALVLVAVAMLLAAGAWTLGEARTTTVLVGTTETA